MNLDDFQIAYLSYDIDDHDKPKPYREFYLNNIKVHEKYRNRGISKILIDKMFDIIEYKKVTHYNHTEYTEEGQLYIKKYIEKKCKENEIIIND